MNDRLIKRNRAIAVLAILFLVASLVVTNEYYPLMGLLSPKPKETPETRIEATSPHTDVIYFAHEPRGTLKSHFAGNTPLVGVGIHWYPPTRAECWEQYHIVLTARGYDIVSGAYDWEPPADEADYRDDIRDPQWNYTKFAYYRDRGGLFAPGELRRAAEAISGTETWYSRKAMVMMLQAIIEEAIRIEDEWRLIEIDIVALGMPERGVGISTDGKMTPIEDQIHLSDRLNATIVLFRARPEEVFNQEEGRWIKAKLYLDEIVKDGLTWDKVEAMQEAGQLQISPGQTFFGPRPYTRGRNCTWQAREVDMLKERLDQ